MGLKPVELQVALPRTKDAGMLQSQLAQKPVQDQEQLAQETMRRLEEQRKRSEQSDPNHALQNRKEDSAGSGGSGQQRDRKPPSEERTAPPPHPYKGRYIDLSL